MPQNFQNQAGQAAGTMPAAQAQALAQTLLRQALAFHQKKQFAQAQSLYESLLRVQPRNIDGLQSFGLLAYQTDRHQTAIELLSRAIEISPKSATLYTNIGLAFQALQRFDEALVSYDKALAINPNFVEAHNNRGDTLMKLNRPNDALIGYDKAIALKPDYAEAYNGSGIALTELTRFDEALLNYDKAIALKPDYAGPYNGRGVVLVELGRLDDALINYDKAISLQPDHAETYYNRGNAQQGLKQSDKALLSYDKAIALKPYYPEAYCARGKVLQKLERLNEALLSYDKAIALKPDYSEAHDSRGNILQGLEPSNEAVNASIKNTSSSFRAEHAPNPSRKHKKPIRPGFERHYANYQHTPSRFADKDIIAINGHDVRVSDRFDKPEIVVFENVLSDAECELLIDLSRSKLQPTRILDRDSSTGKGKISAERSSEGAGFLRGENALIHTIETRLAKLLNLPLENGEALNLLHYVTGAEYRPHYDFFAPEDPGSAAHLQDSGQRVATLVMYLNDVESGGETIFPEIDFSVAPRKGSAVYFSYCDANGKLDRLSLHGGAPVTHGEKWIVTKWIRQREWKARK